MIDGFNYPNPSKLLTSFFLFSRLVVSSLRQDAKQILKLPVAARKAALQAMIARHGSSQQISQYILSPISAVTKMVLHNIGLNASESKVSVHLELEQISVVLDREQYQNTLFLVDYMSRNKKKHVYRHIPSVSSSSAVILFVIADFHPSSFLPVKNISFLLE